MIQTALKNPYLVIVGALAAVVLGLYTYNPFDKPNSKIPADLLPQFETSAVQIVCFYPGMPPEVMEKDIMSRLQRWTGQSVGIEHQEAKAMQGVCVVKDFFREGISMDTAMSQVTSYAMSDMFYLPPGTIPPMVMPFDPTASVPLCLVVVSNPQMDEQQLYDIAYYELRNKLQSIQGVIAPAVYGGKLRRILAYINPHKLESLGLSLMDVQAALLKQNVLIPAGSIKSGDQELHIFTNAIPEKVDELNDTPIKIVDGRRVLMRDIGEVQNSAQIQTNKVRINGAAQVYIPIYRQPGENTLRIIAEIKDQLSTILQRLKTERSEDSRMRSLVLSVAMDQSGDVENRIDSLQIAALLGAALAGLVVLLFLRSFQLTFVVILAIPLAVLVAIVCLYFTGNTINAMTLGGLALAIGILVDQSIVVLENIIRHAQMGKKPYQAALDGAREVAVPVLVATLTFAVVFFPVVFLSGLAKFLFTPLAVAASVAIVASYVISITLVPAYCSRFLRRVSTPAAENARNFAAWYGTLLSGVLKARYLVVLVSAVAFAASLLLVFGLGRELFPQVDSGQMTLYVRMPTGTNIEETEKTVKLIEQEIIDEIGEADPGFAIGEEQHPDSDLQMLITNIGVLMDWPAAYTPNNGPMDAFMLVQLKGKGSVFDYVGRLHAKLGAKYPQVDVAFDTGGMLTAALNMGEPSPIHFQIYGPQLDTSSRIAEVIVERAKGVPGTADVRIAQRIDYPIVEVEIDRDLAMLQGLTPEDVMKNLVSATNSSINFDPVFWIDKNKGNHYFFGVQYPEDILKTIDTLKNIPLGGNPTRRLGNVAKFHRTTGPGVVNHRNITRVIDVYANVLPGYDPGSVVVDIEEALQDETRWVATVNKDKRGEVYSLAGKLDVRNMETDEIEKRNLAGFTFRMMGEVRTMRDSFGQFVGGLIIAAILVYLIMVGQFRSFVDPFVILLTVPLGFIGVVLILYLTGTNLSIMAFMGIIMMVGIVVEYSIVLVDFANRRVEEGLSVRDAVLDAAKVRFRPIMMTSLTTWLALLPMAWPGLMDLIGFGGSEANAPLARAIIGGVLAATLLSLTVVPCLYMIFKRPRRRHRDEEFAPQITG